MANVDGKWEGSRSRVSVRYKKKGPSITPYLQSMDYVLSKFRMCVCRRKERRAGNCRTSESGFGMD